MHVEDPDALKTWLTGVLRPICEADPAALAKYVIALVKKDKSRDDLRQSMISQLEVFLEKETQPFVNLLFKTLESQDYIVPMIPNANPPNPNVKTDLGVGIKATGMKIEKEIKPIIPVSELVNLSEAVNGSKKVTQTEAESPKKEPPSNVRKPPEQPAPSEREIESRRRRTSRHRSSSRNRSRSRSWERSRDRGGDGPPSSHRSDREKRRSWRNKSPPPMSSSAGMRRYERGGGRRSRTPPSPRSSRSRSPRHGGYRTGRYRNRSPPPRSTSRSRSRSLDRKERSKDVNKQDKDIKESRSGAGTPTQDSNHGDMDLRLTNTTQSIQSVVSQQINSDVRSSKRRCRDFDEKGFCMRGEMCPFDHGIDPVVVEDSALSSVLTYTSNGTPMPEIPSTIIPPPMMGAAPMMHPIQPRGLPPEYNPQAPQMWHRTGFRGPRPMLGPGGARVPPIGSFVQQPPPPQPNLQRQLISVPVTDNKQNSSVGDQHQGHYQSGGYGPPSRYDHLDQQHGFKKKPFDFNRLGPPRVKNPANCSLELKKVPQGLNNITHLNNHFSKFGMIVNIQVCYDGDPEAAIVTFSSHAEANVAYRSTEAVLNNRFIKVFWHTGGSDGKQENVPPRSVKDRLGIPNTTPPNPNKVLNLVQPKSEPNAQQQNSDENSSSDQPQEKPATNNNNNNSFTKNNLQKKEVITKAQEVAAIKKTQEMLAAKEKLKKNQEENRKEALKLTQNLRKRKQELLEKQVAHQKLLIEKLEKTPPGPQRDLLKQTIKKSQEAIEAIRRDVQAQTLAVAAAAAAPSKTAAGLINARRSKEEAQKEMLDAELDLITKQQEGGDTTELQKRLMELRARAGMTRSGRGRGGKRYTPIVSRQLLTKNNLVDSSTVLKGNVKGVSSPNKTIFQKHTVDHRPTRLLVSGYEGDEKESVLQHFGQFGEIVDYVSDADTPSIVLNYKTRKEAELAMLKGKNFQDRTLSVTWCNHQQLNTQLSSRSSTRTVLVSESEEDQLINQNLLEGEEEAGQEISEEILLQDDEEEEDENEDRSWRR